MPTTCGFAPSRLDLSIKILVSAWSVVSEGGAHPKTNACWPVNSQLGAGHEPAGGPVDPGDNDRLRGAVGADRRDSLLPAHAHAGRVARAARLGRRADPAVGGRDDRGRVDHTAGRLPRGGAWR